MSRHGRQSKSPTTNANPARRLSPREADRHGPMVPGLGPIHAGRAVLILTLLSIGLTAAIFPPIEAWPVAYVCLVPWLLAVCRSSSSMRAYFVSYLFGVAFFAINAYWIYIVTLPGYFPFILFYGLFPALASWPIRHLVNRRNVPVAIAAPVVWTAVEFLRSLGMLGFPMLLIGHSQFRQQTVIQIADLVGAYGVTFVLVAVNGFIVDLMIQPIAMRRGGRRVRLPIGASFTFVLVLLTFIYGSAQKSDRHMAEGPRVAVVQHDIVQYVTSREDRRLFSPEIFEAHLELARKAAAQRPDLIVMPESIIPGCYPNEEFLNYDRGTLEYIHSRRYARYDDASILVRIQGFSGTVGEAFQGICDDANVSIVLGASAIVSHRTAIPPHVDAMNSAYLLMPSRNSPVARYDKRHLVLLGEYVPFRESWPAAYEWINSLSPYGGKDNHYSLTPGEAFTPFEFNGSGSKPRYRAGTPICYEEIMPYVPRSFARGDGGDEKAIDALFCMSNDGWFFHLSELEQHLAAGVFRAVENRVAVARSVNTGESCLIAPNGRIHARVQLDDEQIAGLSDIESAIQSMLDGIDNLRTLDAKSIEFRSARDELGKILDERLQPAYFALGAEFGLYVDRIARLKANISPRNPVIGATLDSLAGQLAEDMEMVRRWRDRPTTAPGVVVATIRLDPRLTLYTRFGDWFAMALLIATGLAVIDWFIHRLRRKRRIASATEGTTT